MVEEALGIAKYHRRTKGRVIENNVDADLPPAIAVRDHLTQVVLNLLLNALEATAEGGSIRLDASAVDGQLTLTVGDDGRGVAVDDLDRLFQPHFTTKAGGTGLGLFVSRQIVEEHDGTLTHHSEGGRGATFAVRLPIARTSPTLSPVAAGKEGAAC